MSNMAKKKKAKPAVAETTLPETATAPEAAPSHPANDFDVEATVEKPGGIAVTRSPWLAQTSIVSPFVNDARRPIASFTSTFAGPYSRSGAGSRRSNPSRCG